MAFLKSGPFQLFFVDRSPGPGHFVYDLGNGGSIGLVDYTVYAVGSDAHHIVVKQHPRGEKSITNFYIVDLNTSALPLHPERAVTGTADTGAIRREGKTDRPSAVYDCPGDASVNLGGEVGTAAAKPTVAKARFGR